MGWFNRKPKNRRLKRGHVLDVKLRSSQTRAARTRMAGVALSVAFGTVVSLFILWRTGEWLLDRLVYDNKAFAIRQITVQTDGVIAPDQLRRWAGVKPGDNLLALELARVKRDLELVPAVESVAVERVLPHTLQIRVAERVPVAQILVPRPRPGGGFDMIVVQLDTRGVVLLPLDRRQRGIPPNQADELLPVISGINPVELLPGRRVESEQIRAALRLIDVFANSPMVGLVDFQRIDVTSPEILVVTTGQGNEVTFAAKDMERQLLRWREIYEQAQRYQKTIVTLDLSVTNNLPLILAEGSPTPPAKPRPGNPQRSRRKNV